MRRSAPSLLLVLVLAAGCRFQFPAAPPAAGAGAAAVTVDRAERAREVRVRAVTRLVEILRGSYIYATHEREAIDGAAALLARRAAAAADDAAYGRAVRDAVALLPAGDAGWQSRAERVAAESVDPAVYEGIGTYIAFRATPRSRVILLEVMPGSPAETAGLRGHDAILAIDGGPIGPDEAETVTGRIRGPAGSSVRLLARSPGGKDREILVPRGRVDIEQGSSTLRSFILREARIGCLAFPRAPDSNLVDEVTRALDDFASAGVTGIVLDLRIATADSSWPVIGLGGFFTSGELGTFVSASQRQPLEVQGVDRGGSQRIPLALLIGTDTEGMAEIFAASLQASHRAIVVGAKTAGLVEAHQPFALPDGSLLSIAVSSYLASSGVDVGREGVKPDITVAADWDGVAVDRDPVFEAAVKALAPRTAGGRL